MFVKTPLLKDSFPLLLIPQLILYLWKHRRNPLWASLTTSGATLKWLGATVNDHFEENILISSWRKWKRGQELQFFHMSSSTHAHHLQPSGTCGLRYLLQPVLSTYPSFPSIPVPSHYSTVFIQQEFEMHPWCLECWKVATSRMANKNNSHHMSSKNITQAFWPASTVWSI